MHIYFQKSLSLWRLHGLHHRRPRRRLKFAPNLITVKKHAYFQGIGDIHARRARSSPGAEARWVVLGRGQCASLVPARGYCSGFVWFVHLFCFSIREVGWVCLLH